MVMRQVGVPVLILTAEKGHNPLQPVSAKACSASWVVCPVSLYNLYKKEAIMARGAIMAMARVYKPRETRV